MKKLRVTTAMLLALSSPGFAGTAVHKEILGTWCGDEDGWRESSESGPYDTEAVKMAAAKKDCDRQSRDKAGHPPDLLRGVGIYLQVRRGEDLVRPGHHRQYQGDGGARVARYGELRRRGLYLAGAMDGLHREDGVQAKERPPLS